MRNTRGIIPTRVGTRQKSRVYADDSWDHPHACGDKFRKQRKNHNLEGSSPRVWGQVDEDRNVKAVRRIIPTRVGTRIIQPMDTARKEDHPHACGDKHSIIISINITHGSSPRVWGQVYIANQQLKQARIIPTRVGTSLSDFQSVYGTEDHPHACGDKAVENPYFQSDTGSSPRVWGQERNETVFNCNIRIIPTRVGTRFSVATA